MTGTSSLVFGFYYLLQSKRGQGSCPACSAVYHNRYKPQNCVNCEFHLGGTYVPKGKKAKLHAPKCVKLFSCGGMTFYSAKTHSKDSRCIFIINEVDSAKQCLVSQKCQEIRAAFVNSGKVEQFSCVHMAEYKEAVPPMEIFHLTDDVIQKYPCSDQMKELLLQLKSSKTVPCAFRVSSVSYCANGLSTASNPVGLCHVKKVNGRFVCSSPDCGQYASKTKAERQKKICLHLHVLLCVLPITEVSAGSAASQPTPCPSPSSVGGLSEAPSGSSGPQPISCAGPYSVGGLSEASAGSSVPQPISCAGPYSVRGLSEASAGSSVPQPISCAGPYSVGGLSEASGGACVPQPISCAGPYSVGGLSEASGGASAPHLISYASPSSDGGLSEASAVAAAPQASTPQVDSIESEGRLSTMKVQMRRALPYSIPSTIMKKISELDGRSLISGFEVDGWPSTFAPSDEFCSLCSIALSSPHPHPGEKRGKSGYLLTNAVPFESVEILVKHCPKCHAMHQVFPYECGEVHDIVYCQFSYHTCSTHYTQY